MELHSTFAVISLFVAAFGFALGISAALAHDRGRGDGDIGGDERRQMTPTSVAAPGGSSLSTKLESDNSGQPESARELKE